MRPWNNYATNECVAVRCRVNARDIGYICSIVESYEGLAVVSTLNQAEGLVHFYCTVDLRDDFMKFLDRLKEEIPMEIVAEMRLNAAQMYAIEAEHGREHPRRRNLPRAK